MYLLLILGAQIMPRKIKLRILAGTWCLATFVLINYYMTILTSFTTAPNFKALVESIEDLASKDYVKLVVPKNVAVEEMILVNYIHICRILIFCCK